MLLTRLTRYVRKLHDDERGLAMAAVMGLVILGLLLSTIVVSSVVSGLSTTTASRAGVQSQAAAQSGVDVASASLTKGACLASFSSSTVPKYSVSISYSTATAPTPSNGLTIAGVLGSATWTAGCPTASATYVKVVSVGTANTLGARDTQGNSATLEAIYNRPITVTTIPAKGPAVYAYSSQDFGGSGTLVSEDGTNDANVMIKTGNVTCNGSSSAAGSLVIQIGSLTVGGSCAIKGSVWVSSGTGPDGTVYSGSFTLGGGVAVQGDISAQSVSIASGVVGGGIWGVSGVNLSPVVTVGGGVTVTAGNATLNGSNSVAGNVWASGNISITNSDTITGNATAQNVTLNGGNVKGQVFAVNSVTGVTWYTIGGSIVAKTVTSGLTASGGVKTYPGGTPTEPTFTAAAPGQPSVPGWVDFTYVPTAWSGFGTYTLTASQCTAAGLQTAVNSFGGGKGVIDARICPGVLSLGGSDSVTMSNDLAIIVANGFNLGGSFTFKDSTSNNLWLIQPDLLADGKATCPSTNDGITLGGGFNLEGGSGRINALLYTPCLVNIGSGIQFYGQVFSGETEVNGSAKLFYTPVGLAGWDLSTGSATSSTTTTNVWTLVSNRNIAG